MNPSSRNVHPDNHSGALSDGAERTEPALRVLAFDAGFQATSVLLLALEEQIDPFDLIISVDRVHEHRTIRAEAARAQQIAISSGIPVLRTASNSSAGEAVEAKIREVLGHPPPRPVPHEILVDLAVGVSLDEIHLATASSVPYIQRCFPLLDLGWGHRECQAYLRSLRYERSNKARRRWSL